MELQKIKDLIEMMKANDLSELEIVDGQTRIMLKRGQGGQVLPSVVALPSAPPAPPAVGPVVGEVARGAATDVGEKAKEAAAPEEEKLVDIVSPLVGTFYAAPSPNADPFVELDQQVEEDTVVCIIEAMKVMNEIKSEVKGTVRKILVSNGESVEYGQAMFLVELD